MSGKVFLVGAGPGDPGLLTQRAAELIRNCDVVVIDALVSADIRLLIPSKTEVIEAGKRASKHTMTQDAINQLLVELGQAGRRVVRLKGGDPFVFGRGGEEAEALSAAGVRFEIVPGISSSVAAPAYAGIPVTHRTAATSFTVVTAHESDESSGVDWDALARVPGTLVFLMGLRALPNIVERLISHGVDAAKPIAVIASGTTSSQRTVTGALSTIVAKVTEAALEPPALIVVGDVVRLRESIGWFEKRPLFDRGIVVTRARNQASELSRLLAEEGATPLEFPTIAIVDPPSFDSLDTAIAALDSYDWIVFSSTNGVERFFLRLTASGLDARALAQLRIAAVGSSTAEELKAHGIVADLVPERFVSTALLPLLGNDQSGVRTLIVRAMRGNDELIDELRRRGGEVDLAFAYETRSLTEGDATLRELLHHGEIDAITFTSGSTVENFFEQLGSDVDLSNVVLASIGPQTSKRLRELAGRVDLEAKSADIASLRDALVEHFSS